MSAAPKSAEHRERFPRVLLDEATIATEGNYLIKGVIDKAILCVAYGPPGEGKGFFSIDLAGHIAAGLTWHGRRVSQGLVVYVAAEAGASILRRFVAWRNRNIGEAREEAVPLAIFTCGPNLLDPSDTAALLAALREIVTEVGLPLVLIVLDTLSRSIPGGNENAPEVMGAVVKFADRVRDEFGASTLLVHHTGKDNTKGARGHSALVAAADTVICVADRTATIEKSRDSTAGEAFGFELETVEVGVDDDDDPITTCVIEEADAPPKRTRAQQLPAAAQVALRALKEAVAAQGVVIEENGAPPGTLAVELATWRKQFKSRYGDDDRGERAVRQAFTRAREALLKSGTIEIYNPWVWLPGE